MGPMTKDQGQLLGSFRHRRGVAFLQVPGLTPAGLPRTTDHLDFQRAEEAACLATSAVALQIVSVCNRGAIEWCMTPVSVCGIRGKETYSRHVVRGQETRAQLVGHGRVCVAGPGQGSVTRDDLDE
jgi:hypothetical protein